ncbi:MAG: hypothetical protein IPM23_03700 [Candidatus Melainabacteria bacterium]|nr:hypothetical protein [Candidatus Melainabacteria bacterium]
MSLERQFIQMLQHLEVMVSCPVRRETPGKHIGKNRGGLMAVGFLVHPGPFERQSEILDAARYRSGNLGFLPFCRLRSRPESSFKSTKVQL